MADALISGNVYDKYNSRNLIVRHLMDGFLSSFDELSALAKAQSAWELGCGEGHLSIRLAGKGLSVSASDLSEDVIATARENAVTANVDIAFSVADAQDPPLPSSKPDLIVCCEVLEHLPDPHRALRNLSNIEASYFLLSVPNEPLWRVLNMTRGKYLSDFGNTPGHLNHWSPAGFVELVSNDFTIREVRRPLPWTMVLCTPKPKQ